jgi:ATP-dependent protease ClpP protease subunit
MRADRTAYISFSAEINVSTAELLLGTIFDQIAQGATGIYLLFSSAGGFVDPAIALYNTLKGLPVPLTIHNVGNVDSSANAVFMAGHHRYACKHSSFLFHGIKWNFAQYQAVDGADLQEIAGNLSASETKIAGIVSDQSSLKREEVRFFFSNAQTIDATLALSKAIIHEIREVQLPVGTTPLQLVIRR